MTFQDDITRMLAEGYERLLADANARLSPGTPDLIVDPLLLFTNDATKPTITVTKSSAYLMLSVDQQLDAGLITEEQARAQGWTPYVPLPVPWHRRARWRWQSWRERVGRRVGGWLAGVDLSERDEDW